VGFCFGLSFFIDDEGSGFLTKLVIGQIGSEVTGIAIAVELAVDAVF
jgi:hypothetical protein